MGAVITCKHDALMGRQCVMFKLPLKNISHSKVNQRGSVNNNAIAQAFVYARFGRLLEQVSKIFKNALCFSLCILFLPFVFFIAQMTVWFLYSDNLSTQVYVVS